MKTRDRIIAAAIDLFNEQGTKGVTTNHIAAAVGISPGNLYYHFRNKGDILRAIFEEMDAYGLERYREITAETPPGTLAAMERCFVMIQEYNWRYRFFKRELTALLLDDPLLRERFRLTHRQMLAIVRQSNECAVALGVFRPLAERELDLLSEAIWMVALFWLNYLEVGGEPVDDAGLGRGIEQLRLLIAPYLTEGARAELAAKSERPVP
ncbi:TetR/AcrR family transcriptional regulator [Trichloromonas sp.]|uniref:TetR/AcrR family transcriptional regulator n=1 Tax=Trichloromonas sp. TaxID=3069249 RepID=UPI002A478AE6|nr:TetR/AcrR family transcriptional regulator [Trichloromonas sp.]